MKFGCWSLNRLLFFNVLWKRKEKKKEKKGEKEKKRKEKSYLKERKANKITFVFPVKGSKNKLMLNSRLCIFSEEYTVTLTFLAKLPLPSVRKGTWIKSYS